MVVVAASNAGGRNKTKHQKGANGGGSEYDLPEKFADAPNKEITSIRLEKQSLNAQGMITWTARRAVLSQSFLVFYDDEMHQDFKLPRTTSRRSNNATPTDDAKSSATPTSTALGELDRIPLTEIICLTSKFLEQQGFSEYAASKEHFVAVKNPVFQTASDTKEMSVLLRTMPAGRNCGRNYTLCCQNGAEFYDWVTTLSAAIDAAKDWNAQMALDNWIGPSKFAKLRYKCNLLYEGETAQLFVGFLIVCSFAVDVSEAEILPVEDTAEHLIFWTFSVVFTSLFTIELLINLFARSNNNFRPFLADIWNILDVFVVSVCLVSLLLNNPVLKMLRLVRIFRVARLFKRIRSLNRIINALVSSLFPVFNSFAILLLITCIYATLFTHIFGGTDMDVNRHFSSFSVSLFTMFQVVTGDSWASSVTRGLFTGKENEPWISFMMISYVLIAGIVLINIVVAVLLDEFISSVTAEKEEIERKSKLEKEEQDVAARVTGVLDPFVAQLAGFCGSGDLYSKIDDSYTVLDEDGSGGLSFEEFSSSISLLPTPVPMSVMADDFDVLTQDGAYLNEEGEFSAEQFQDMMRGELQRFSQRSVQNAMQESNSNEFKSVLLALKLLDLQGERNEALLRSLTAAGGGGGGGGERGEGEQGGGGLESVGEDEEAGKEVGFRPIKAGGRTRNGAVNGRDGSLGLQDAALTTLQAQMATTTDHVQKMDAKLDALCDMVQGLAAATSASALQRQPQFHAADRPARPRPRSTATIDEPPARVAPLRDGMGVEGESWIRGWSPGTKAQEDSQSVTHIPSRFDVAADVAGTALGPQGCAQGGGAGAAGVTARGRPRASARSTNVVKIQLPEQSAELEHNARRAEEFSPPPFAHKHSWPAKGGRNISTSTSPGYKSRRDPVSRSAEPGGEDAREAARQTTSLRDQSTKHQPPENLRDALARKVYASGTGVTGPSTPDGPEHGVDRERVRGRDNNKQTYDKERKPGQTRIPLAGGGVGEEGRRATSAAAAVGLSHATLQSSSFLSGMATGKSKLPNFVVSQGRAPGASQLFVHRDVGGVLSVKEQDPSAIRKGDTLSPRTERKQSSSKGHKEGGKPRDSRDVHREAERGLETLWGSGREREGGQPAEKRANGHPRVPELDLKFDLKDLD